MDYPALRASLDPRYGALLSEELESFVVSRLGASPEQVEDFLGSLQDFGRTAGSVFQRALPGAVQGASTGAAFGPWGALIGALGGGAMSAIGPGGQAQPAAPQPAQAGQAAPAAQPTSAGQGTSPAQAAAPSSLLGLLARPEVIQALGALALGNSGRPTVQVGSTQVPTGAIANLISVLGAQAAAGAPAGRPAQEDVEEIPQYFRRADGSLRVQDPMSSQDRAGALLELFQATPVLLPFEELPEDVEELEAYDGEDLYESVLSG